MQILHYLLGYFKCSFSFSKCRAFWISIKLKLFFIFEKQIYFLSLLFQKVSNIQCSGVINFYLIERVSVLKIKGWSTMAFMYGFFYIFLLFSYITEYFKKHE